MPELDILVVSDLHADEVPNRWTHVLTEPPSPAPLSHPLRDLVTFAQREGLVADYLMATGDLTNQANPLGLQYAWRQLHTLASIVEAKVIGVPGNHDVVTHRPAVDRSAMLQNLLPSFPTGDLNGDQQFWEKGFCIIEREAYRFLVINSTFDFPEFPEGAAEDSDEWRDYLSQIDRGGFSPRIETQLDAQLSGLAQKLNIALVHHHPQEHQLQAFMRDGYGPMRRGDDLLSLLARHNQAGRWLLIHGHKHIPQLVHAGGQVGSNVTVLCAASLGAKLWDRVSTITRNQFHIVKVSDTPAAGLGTLRGTVESYSWSESLGWISSPRKASGLPQTSGFGCVDDYRDLGRQIILYMEAGGYLSISFSELLVLIPRLRYQIPSEFELLEEFLEDAGYIFIRNPREVILELVKEMV